MQAATIVTPQTAERASLPMPIEWTTPAPQQRNRGLAAVLAGCGALLATSGRTRAAERVTSAAIGYRTLIRLRAAR